MDINQPQMLLATRPDQCDAAIVDDEPLLSDCLAHMIERQGLSVAQIPLRGNVVEAIIAARPQLLFLDLSLGRLDAIEILQELKTCGFGGLIALMSGHGAATIDRVHALGLRLGFRMSKALSKPFVDADVTMVLSLLQRRGEGVTPLVDINEAIAKDWLQLWYQPQIDVRRLTLCGAEALLRLQHPRLGLLPPAAFLPSFEGDAHEAITNFVIGRVARDWATLGQLGLRLPASINASAEMLQRKQLLPMITAAWPDPKRRPPLILEITEGEAITDVAVALDNATQLALHGVQLSIDDFGLAHSGFARLRDLPFSEIKLDRSFVAGCSSDPRLRAFCEAAVSLARQFGIRATAEGVETGADLTAIREIGFDTAQGYYFARPAPFAAFHAQLLRRAKPKNVQAPARLGARSARDVWQ